MCSHKKPPCGCRAALRIVKRGILIELSLVLTGSFRLLLTLQAGAHVMLSALDFLNNAGLGTGTLEPLQSRFQRFIFFNMNFRHG
jgi:hypothetical protein